MTDPKEERKEVLENLNIWITGLEYPNRPPHEGEWAIYYYRDYRLLKIISKGGDDFRVIKNGGSFDCVKDNLQKVIIKAMDEIDKDE